jgi:hypothetical protein
MCICFTATVTLPKIFAPAVKILHFVWKYVLRGCLALPLLATQQSSRMACRGLLSSIYSPNNSFVLNVRLPASRFGTLPQK